MDIKKIILISSLALLLASPCFADIVHLKGNEDIEGDVIEEKGEDVTIMMKQGTVTVKKYDIIGIDKKELIKEEKPAFSVDFNFFKKLKSMANKEWFYNLSRNNAVRIASEWFFLLGLAWILLWFIVGDFTVLRGALFLVCLELCTWLAVMFIPPLDLHSYLIFLCVQLFVVLICSGLAFNLGLTKAALFSIFFVALSSAAYIFCTEGKGGIEYLDQLKKDIVVNGAVENRKF